MPSLLSESSSSDNSTAPTDFNICQSDAENSTHSTPMERCNICKQKRRAFYCAECVRTGDITHSKAKFPQKFSEKKLQLSIYERDRHNLSALVEERSRSYRQIDEIRQKMELTRQRIDARKRIIESVKKEITAARQEGSSMQKEWRKIREKKESLPARKKVCREETVKINNVLREYNERLGRMREKIGTVVRVRLADLGTYIFPIEERSTSPPLEAEGQLKELAEACQTHYIRGRWVYSNHSVDATYSIVYPCLPADGNYSQLVDWVQQRQEQNPPRDDSQKAAFEVSAGLMHITHMVSLLSFYLDLKLPYGMCFSEFSADTLTEEGLANKIARLNANVVYMCASQNVDPVHIRPRQTVRNLLNILNMSETLPRNEAFEMSSELTHSVEDTLTKHLCLYDVHAEMELVGDPREGNENSPEDEWEQVVSSGVPSTIEASTQMSRYTYSTTSVLTRQTSQGASTLFSSAAAFYNQWWGRSE